MASRAFTTFSKIDPYLVLAAALAVLAVLAVLAGFQTLSPP